MKHIIRFALVLALLCTGCSDDSSSSNSSPDFRLSINGVEKIIPSKDYPNNGLEIGLLGNVFHVFAYYGVTENHMSSHLFELIFDKNGNIISVKSSANDQYGDFTYANYNFFPSNYFHLNIISLDENSKKIKLSFSGNLYLNGNTTANFSFPSLDRESIEVEGEVNMNYEEWEGPDTGMFYGSYEQYCNAKFNGVAWEANRANEVVPPTYTYGTFMASDPYKIEIHFGQAANLGPYNFTTTSTENNIKFSKFNTTTLTYDYYNVNGVLTNEYKEYHGGISYSYFGSYTFTATNPNNPSDIIQVTDGKFRYFQPSN